MLVELKDAEIGHEDIPILSHVGLTVDEGEFVYLIGKVGTGKSSILKRFMPNCPFAPEKAACSAITSKR